MKSEIPEFPNPYPFERSSSRRMTTTPEKVSYITIKIAFPDPILSSSPYIPEYTYANASHNAIINPSNFYAPLNRALSSLLF